MTALIRLRLPFVEGVWSNVRDLDLRGCHLMVKNVEILVGFCLVLLT